MHCGSVLAGLRSASSWVRPPVGKIKINVDAHILASFYVGLEVAVRNDRGELMLAATRRIEGEMDVELAEIAAVRYGMILAKRFGYDRIWVEGDAMNVVRTIDSNIKGEAPAWLLYDDICKLSSQFEGFIISHVKRGGNTVAHHIARWDTRGSSELVCMNSFPQSVSTLVDFDLK